MIKGFATYKGTSEYFKRNNFPHRTSTLYCVSLIAIGTHLGERNVEDSIRYRESIEFGLQHGLNFVDTAINYRGMRSERDVGFVLKSLIAEKELINRDEIVVSTKGGIIPGDIEINLVPTEYLKKILLENNIIKESDLNIVNHHRHVLAPSYYQFAISESKKHLNLQTIDIYYVHNPEISMMVLGPERFYRKLEELFSFLEEQVQADSIKYYGFATWFGLLKSPEESGYISIEQVCDVARMVGGANHHFRFIQFPYNRQMSEAGKIKNQKVKGDWRNLLEAADALGLFATTSAPFNLGDEVNDGKNASRTLMNVVETEGIFSTMVGMKNLNHIKENIETIKQEV